MRGFTLVEVMVALLIMGLVATASLKMVALSERALAGVREREQLIDASTAVQMILMADPSKVSGVSGDIEWKVRDERRSPFADIKIDIDKLVSEAELGKLGGTQDLKTMELRWRELLVTRKGLSMTLFLPPGGRMISQP